MTSGSKQHTGSGKTSSKPSSSSDSKESKKKDESKEAPPPPPPTKVVVRRLPPTMTRDQFVEHVSPLPDHDYLHFSGPDPSLGPANGCAQATINFLEAEDVWDFREKFDGYVFDVGDGREHSAIVEFAPNQKAPKHRGGVGESLKADPKMGTLEDDRDYVKFMDALENAEQVETAGKAKTIEQYMEEVEARERELRNNKTYTTPLLDFVREQRQEKRAKRDLKRDARKKREKERKELRDEERKKRRDKKEADENKQKSGNPSKHSDTNDTKAKEVRPAERPPKRERGRNRRGEGREPREDGGRGEGGKGQQASKAEDESKKGGGRRRGGNDGGKWDRRSEPKQAEPTSSELSGKQVGNSKSSSSHKEGGHGANKEGREASQPTRDNNKAREQRKKEQDLKKEKVKNKERPAMEIYRPGMGRFSSQSLKGGAGAEANKPRPDSSSSKPVKNAPRTPRKDEVEKRPSTAENDPGKNRSAHGRGANNGRRQQEQSGRGKQQEATSNKPAPAPKVDEKRSTPAKERPPQSQPPAKPHKKDFGPEGGSSSSTPASAVSAPAAPADGGKSGKSYRDKRRERQLMRANKDGAAADT